MSKNLCEHDKLLGTVIGDDYQIEEKLGLGGMGAVFKAKQISVARTVAVKVILPEKMQDATLVQRFLREARTGLLLSHPNIVKTYKCSRSSKGLLFIVMEYINGETLQKHLEETGRLSLKKCLKFLTELCGALEEAHNHKVLHRDLKPENILLDKDSQGELTTKLTDFGIAKILSSDKTSSHNTALTKTGEIVGTPKYMSPEQLLGIAIKQTSDIYSLGLIVYRMLVGVTPMEFEGKTGTIFKVTQELPPISSKFSFLPESFDQVFQKVLSRDPALRYQKAMEFLQDFENLVTKYPSLEIPPIPGTVKEETNMTFAPTVLIKE